MNTHSNQLLVADRRRREPPVAFTLISWHGSADPDRENAQVLPSFLDGPARIGAGNLHGDQNGLFQTIIFSSSTHVHPSSLRRILVPGELEAGAAGIRTLLV